MFGAFESIYLYVTLRVAFTYRIGNDIVYAKSKERYKMSVIVTLCLYDGIVMAADSRMTLLRTYPNGRQEISYRDRSKKIFRFGDYNRIAKTASIKEIAHKINEECNKKVQGETIRCHIAGYEKGTQCLYQVVDGVVTHKNINPTLGLPTMCIVWDGQRDISSHIIKNKEKIDIGDKVVDESDIPGFTLDEGVRFAEAMLKISCKERDDCGEPIYSLIITSDKFRWIHNEDNR